MYVPALTSLFRTRVHENRIKKVVRYDEKSIVLLINDLLVNELQITSFWLLNSKAALKHGNYSSEKISGETNCQRIHMVLAWKRMEVFSSRERKIKMCALSNSCLYFFLFYSMSVGIDFLWQGEYILMFELVIEQ